MRLWFWMMVPLVLAACSDGDFAPAVPVQSSAARMPVEIDPAVTTSVDQQLAQLQKRLPLKQEQVTVTHALRQGNRIVYHYTVSGDTGAAQMDEVAAKRAAQGPNCRSTATKRVLASGFEFVYVYHFADQSQKAVTFTAADCP